MKHPNEQKQKSQEEYLKNCPPEEREFNARLFRIGNATYRYHLLATADKEDIPEEYFFEWLEGLPEPIRADMKKKGFEVCKSILPFTRYVNERRDIGLEQWLKDHLSPEDYLYHNGLKG